MAVNRRYVSPREFGSSTVPSICNEDFGRSRPAKVSPPLSSLAMPILVPGGSKWDDEVPPPLPPPKYLDVDRLADLKDGRQNDLDDNTLSEDRHYKMRNNSFGREPDEGYHSLGSARTLSSPRFSMHHAFQFRAADAGIDSFMLNKLNSRRSVDNRSPPKFSPLSSSAFESTSSRASPKQLPVLSLPDRTRQLHHQAMLDSPNRYTQTPVFSAASPHSNPFSHPEYTGDPDHYVRRAKRNNSGSVADDMTVSTQGSYETREEDIEFPGDETYRLRRLELEDRQRERDRDRGQKRRASSPLLDDPPLPSDQFRRRDGQIMARGSPTPRLTPIPQSSVSSVSSAGGRSGSSSYASMITASSMTSYGRRSPRGRSPVSPTDYESPSYPTPMSIAALSPRSSMSRAVPHQQQRTSSMAERPMMSPRNMAEQIPAPKGSSPSVASKLQGFFMCECCPKKPKKFETREELSSHEAEKQYECSFCGNRFKNKNEAERHQNSLHVRRHSWSCSALTGYERAFHESTLHPGEADTCGYCGDEFARTGPPGNHGHTIAHGGMVNGVAGSGRFISDVDWEERIRHLQDVHKFRECNSSKKFYRADHFRQHLKHSHAGTSGKWTNMLENACMMEEDPPVPIIRRS